MFDFDPLTWGLLALLLWAIAFVAIQSGRMKRKRDKMSRRFLEAEEEANAVRKRPLEDALFYTAEFDRLPPLPEGDPHRVERAAKRKMIRFTEPMSNLELKKRYGHLQLEYLAHYEENFEEYLRALTKWGEALKKDNKNADAARILEHAVALGSEFRNSYKLLAEIYAQAKNAEKLEELLEKVVFKTFRDPATANHIIEHIRELQEALPR